MAPICTTPLKLCRLALLASALMGGCATAAGSSSSNDYLQPQERPELVVLVHGLGRTPFSMLPLEWALEREGFEVINWGYSSTCCEIRELGDRLRSHLTDEVGSEPREIHFVGHSLGNIIVRWVLANAPELDAGRVVMLAPPNQGSHEADRYARWLGWMLKPLPELRTGPDSPIAELRLPPGAEVGIIAGAHDGKVTLAETRLPGAIDHVVVPAGHTFLMLREDVLELISRFLRDGAFDVAGV